jgi:hypothetical protein
LLLRRLNWPECVLTEGTGLFGFSVVWFVTGSAAALAAAVASYHGVEVFFIRLKDRPLAAPVLGREPSGRT